MTGMRTQKNILHIQTSLHCCRLLIAAMLMMPAMQMQGQQPVKNGSTWYSLYNTTEYHNEDHTYDVYAPTNRNLTFQWKKTGWLIGYPIFSLSISESNNNGSTFSNSQNVVNSGANKKQDSYTNGSATISIDINKINFDQSGSLERYYKNVQLPLAQHIRLDYNNTYFGTADYTTTLPNTVWGSKSAPTEIRFRSFLTSTTDGNMVISCDQPEIFRIGTANNTSGLTYNAGKNVCATKEGTGATNAPISVLPYNFNVYFCPAEPKKYEATITISNGTSKAYVHVSGTGLKQTPVIDECPVLSVANVTYGDLFEDILTSGSAIGDQGQSVAGKFTANEDKPTGCTTAYTLTFTPTNTTLYNTTNNGNPITCQFTLDLNKFTKASQAITWTDAAGTLTGDHTFTATAGEGVTVWYSSSDETVAVMQGSTIHWLKAGEVVITAHADGDCNYNEAEPVSKTFSMSQSIPTVQTPPTATSISFGQTLNSSTLSGGVVKYGSTTISGTWHWVYPDLQPEVGTTQQQVMFTPDNAAYASVTTQVNVTVGKLTPDITYISARLWRGRSVYSNPFRTTNHEAGFSSVTFTKEDGSALDDPAMLTWDPATQSIVVGYVYKEDDEGNVLWDYSGNYKVRVCQPETEHFEACCVEFVNPARRKSDVCLPVIGLDMETYSKMRIEGDGTGWSSSTGSHRDKYLGVGVTYNTWKGISIGTWKDGFSIIPGDGRSVVLSFTGVPDKLSFSTKAEAAEADNIGFITNNVTNNQWSIQQSKDGTNWEWLQNKTANGTQISSSQEYQLDPDTRYVKITYYGNFAGYILADDFKITRRHGYEVKDNSGNWVPATSTTLPQFGVDDGTSPRPLQLPQQLPIRYFSIGDCQEENSVINISTASGNDYFYADVNEAEHDQIRHNVDFDQWGEDVLTIRNTGINVSGVIRLAGSNGDALDINVSAAKPDIFPTKHHLFYTGTEQYQRSETDPYRGLMEHDLTLCFAQDGTPLFDSLYIFGVTGNTEAVRNKFDYFDTYKGYWLPKVNVPTETVACNAHTPLFVYQKASGKYTWARTVKNVSATGLQNMHANDKKLAFIGYCPYAYTGKDETQDGFIYFTGDGTHSTEITLFGTEIGARPHTADGTTAEAGYKNEHQTELHEGDNGVAGNGSLFAFRKTTNNGKPYNVNFHIWGTNVLRSTRGTNVNVKFGSQALQMHQSSAPISVNTSSTDSCVNISINDVYDGVHTVESSLTLVSSEKTGVIDIGNEKSTLTVNGGIINMINGNKPESPLAVSYQRTLLEDENGRVAILYGSGRDQTDAHVYLNDGTMLGEENIRMPWNTVVTGGTYLKDIDCYQTLGGTTGRPVDAEGKKVNRVSAGMLASELPEGYGHESVIADENAKLYPLLPRETREDLTNPWVAALPDKEGTAAAQNSNLLYMEVANGLCDVDGSKMFSPVTSTENYTVDGTLSMLIQLDRADRWRTIVAPFNVKRVYVLEPADESGLKYKSDRATLIARQKAAAEGLYEYLQPYIAPTEEGRTATLLPLRALISKYRAEHVTKTDDIIFPLVHYDGTNYNSSNYYLYQVPQTGSEPALWEIDGDNVQSSWDYVKAKSDGSETIMQQGHTYSMSFMYCPTCDDDYHNNRYDYWTGKFILFEGTGGQTINGTDNAGLQTADPSKAVMTGNSSLGMIDASNVYRFNPESDMYEKASGSVELSPIESVMLLPAGRRAAAVRRSGQIIYSDNDDTGNGDTTTDNLNITGAKEGAQKVLRNGNIYIIREGETYTITGQKAGR